MKANQGFYSLAKRDVLAQVEGRKVGSWSTSRVVFLSLILCASSSWQIRGLDWYNDHEENKYN